MKSDEIMVSSDFIRFHQISSDFIFLQFFHLTICFFSHPDQCQIKIWNTLLWHKQTKFIERELQQCRVMNP